MGVSNSIATIPGIAGNMITGAILAGHDDDWGESTNKNIGLSMLR
jgi:hypothetical protein